MQRRNNRHQRILELFEENKTLSICKANQQLNIPTTTIFRALKSNHYKPYHLTPVQALHPGDDNRRLEFCRFLSETNNQDTDFLKKIILSDESRFTRRCIVNFHNLHVWRTENPHEARPRNFQRI